MYKSVEGGLKVIGCVAREGGGVHRYAWNKKHYSNRTWPAAVSSTDGVRSNSRSSYKLFNVPAKHARNHEAVVRSYLY